jgi:ribosome-associated protein
MLAGIELAHAAARFADEIQAEDIAILDLRGLSTLTDFFVVCSANSQPHLKAVRRDIVHKLADECDTQSNHVEGSSESQWLVLDYIDVIVHVFHRDKREVYNIEDLWSDAPRIEFESSQPAPKTEGVESEA